MRESDNSAMTARGSSVATTTSAETKNTAQTISSIRSNPVLIVSDVDKTKSSTRQRRRSTLTTQFANTLSYLSGVNSDEPLSNTEEAAILVGYARGGQILDISNLTSKTRFCYRIRHRYQVLFRLAAWGIIVLHIFERPIWTFSNTHSNWSDGAVYPSFGLTYMPFIGTTLLTGLCLSVLWVAVLLDFGFKRFTSNSYLTWLFACLLLVSSSTVVVYLAQLGAGHSPSYSVMPADVLFLLLIEPAYDNNIGYLLRTIPNFTLLILTLAAFVCTYTGLGFLIFDPNSDEAYEYFNFYGTAVWNMLMVLNGSDWPTPMIPAFQQNRAFCIYFFIYIILVDWGLLNLVLGFVYLFFRVEQHDIALRQDVARASYLIAAFRILDVDKKGYLTYDQVDELLVELYSFYEHTSKQPTQEERHELILQLDIQSNNIIDERDFQYIQEKCLSRALKVSRSRKRKFTRYVNAHISKQEEDFEVENPMNLSESSLQRTTENPMNLSERSCPSQQASFSSNDAQRQQLRGGSIISNSIGLERISEKSDRSDGIEAGVASARLQGPPTAASRTIASGPTLNHAEMMISRQSSASESSGEEEDVVTIIPPEECAPPRPHSGIPANRSSESLDIRPSSTSTANRRSNGGRLSLTKRVTNASEYAGNIEDPKVLELYSNIEMLRKLDTAGKQHTLWGRTVRYSAAMALWIDSIYFDILADTFICLLGILFMSGFSDDAMIIFYLTVSLLEFFIKMLVKGSYRYLKSNRNSVDGLLTISLFVAVVASAATPSTSAHTERVGLRAIILLRTLLFPRNIIVTKGFKTFRQRHRLAFTYAFKSAGHFSFLLLVLFVMMYGFAAAGQLLFGGTISKDGSSGDLIDGSLYGQNDYWPLNFNDMPSGLVTMFTLLSVNNMHVTTSGFVVVRGQWCEIFFALWYTVGVLFLMNVLTAVFLNQFAGYLEKLALQKRRQQEAAALESARALEQQAREIEAQERDSNDSLPATDEGAVAGAAVPISDEEVKKRLAIGELERQSSADSKFDGNEDATPSTAPAHRGTLSLSPSSPTTTADNLIPTEAMGTTTTTTTHVEDIHRASLSIVVPSSPSSAVRDRRNTDGLAEDGEYLGLGVPTIAAAPVPALLLVTGRSSSSARNIETPFGATATDGDAAAVGTDMSGAIVPDQGIGAEVNQGKQVDGPSLVALSPSSPQPSVGSAGRKGTPGSPSSGLHRGRGRALTLASSPIIPLIKQKSRSSVHFLSNMLTISTDDDDLDLDDGLDMGVGGNGIDGGLRSPLPIASPGYPGSPTHIRSPARSLGADAFRTARITTTSPPTKHSQSFKSSHNHNARAGARAGAGAGASRPRAYSDRNLDTPLIPEEDQEQDQEPDQGRTGRRSHVRRSDTASRSSYHGPSPERSTYLQHHERPQQGQQGQQGQQTSHVSLLSQPPQSLHQGSGAEPSRGRARARTSAANPRPALLLPQSSAMFSSSIFASNTDRQKLEEWVRSYYPVSPHPAGAGTGVVHDSGTSGSNAVAPYPTDDDEYFGAPSSVARHRQSHSISESSSAAPVTRNRGAGSVSTGTTSAVEATSTSGRLTRTSATRFTSPGSANGMDDHDDSHSNDRDVINPMQQQQQQQQQQSGSREIGEKASIPIEGDSGRSGASGGGSSGGGRSRRSSIRFSVFMTDEADSDDDDDDDDLESAIVVDLDVHRPSEAQVDELAQSQPASVTGSSLSPPSGAFDLATLAPTPSANTMASATATKKVAFAGEAVVDADDAGRGISDEDRPRETETGTETECNNSTSFRKMSSDIGAAATAAATTFVRRARSRLSVAVQNLQNIRAGRVGNVRSDPSTDSRYGGGGGGGDGGGNNGGDSGGGSGGDTHAVHPSQKGGHSVAAQSITQWMYGVNRISRQAKAAVLVQFARDGEEHSIFSSQRGLACFRWRTQYSYLFRASAVFLAVLRFFERPLWTFYHSNWADNAQYPTSGIYLLSPSAMLGLKLPLLLVMFTGLLLELGYKESSFRNVIRNITPMRVCRYVLTLYCIAQILMLFAAAGGSPAQLVTITSCGNILYVLWFNRRSLHKFKIVLRIVPRLSIVLLLFFMMVLLFAGFGPFIFDLESEHDADDAENSEYFDSFSTSIWSVFVAITSSDYPNQIMPSYREYREVCIYFVTFITVGAFGVLNLIIVIVLVEFQKASQLAADIQRASRQVLLIRAFEVLDPEQRGYVERSQIKLLLDELYQHYSDFQKAGIPKGAARNILMDILDIDGDGLISIGDFMFFLDVTRIKLSVDTPKTFIEIWFPAAVETRAFGYLKKAITSHYFDISVDSIVALLMLINLGVNYRNVYNENDASATLTHLAVLVLVFELICKLVVRGYHNFKRSFRNKVDAILTITAILALIAGDGYKDYDGGNVNGFTILVRILIVFRLILYPRNIRFFFRNQGLKKFARLLRRIFAKIYTLGMVFLCTLYAFASIGVFAYGGLINKYRDNNSNYHSLQNSQFAQNDFWGLNFNDFLSAWITLFCCLHVSDFDVIASGFTSTTSDYSRLYFMVWYVVGVLLMLNILKSFFLGEFLALFMNPKIRPELQGSSETEAGAPQRTERVYSMYKEQHDEKGGSEHQEGTMQHDDGVGEGGEVDPQQLYDKEAAVVREIYGYAKRKTDKGNQSSLRRRLQKRLQTRLNLSAELDADEYDHESSAEAFKHSGDENSSYDAGGDVAAGGGGGGGGGIDAKVQGDAVTSWTTLGTSAVNKTAVSRTSAERSRGGTNKQPKRVKYAEEDDDDENIAIAYEDSSSSRDDKHPSQSSSGTGSADGALRPSEALIGQLGPAAMQVISKQKQQQPTIDDTSSGAKPGRSDSQSGHDSVKDIVQKRRDITRQLRKEESAWEDYGLLSEKSGSSHSDPKQSGETKSPAHVGLGTARSVSADGFSGRDHGKQVRTEPVRDSTYGRETFLFDLPTTEEEEEEGGGKGGEGKGEGKEEGEGEKVVGSFFDDASHPSRAQRQQQQEPRGKHQLGQQLPPLQQQQQHSESSSKSVFQRVLSSPGFGMSNNMASFSSSGSSATAISNGTPVKRKNNEPSRFVASTAKVKDLDDEGKELLRRRIRDLAKQRQHADSNTNNPTSLATGAKIGNDSDRVTPNPSSRSRTPPPGSTGPSTPSSRSPARSPPQSPTRPPLQPPA